MTIRDSAEDSAAAAGDVLELCKMVNESPKWSLWWSWYRCKVVVMVAVTVVSESGLVPVAGCFCVCSGASDDGRRAAFLSVAGAVGVREQNKVIYKKENEPSFFFFVRGGCADVVLRATGVQQQQTAHTCECFCVTAVAWYSSTHTPLTLWTPYSAWFSSWSQNLSRPSSLNYTCHLDKRKQRERTVGVPRTQVRYGGTLLREKLRIVQSSRSTAGSLLSCVDGPREPVIIGRVAVHTLPMTIVS